jgi:hypothetical protein
VAQAFNPSTWEAEASLVYKVSSRTARATQRNPVSEKKKKKKVNKISGSWEWWHTGLTLVFRRQRQADFCEFKASQVYTASGRPTEAKYSELFV